MKLKPISQQSVVVVGAASGIGRETALRFALRGEHVFAIDVEAAGLQSLEQEILAAGGSVASAVADTASFEQVQTAAAAAVTAFGRIDTWIQLAAVAVYATVEQTSIEEFQRVINVNLMGQIYGAK